MKKKSLSRILALGLTAVMTAGMLAGCGGGDGESKSSEASGGASEESSAEESSAEESSEEAPEESSEEEGGQEAEGGSGEVPTLVYWTVGGNESRQVVCTLEQEDIVENLKLLHSWYTAGIINPDANVMTDSGKGHMFGNAQGWPSAAAGWAVGQGIDKYIVNKVFGPIYTTETIQGSMNAISVNSNYKEEALKVLQLMNTDSKFRDMCAYGIEGNHFEYTEDGFVNRLRDDWVWPSYTQGTFFIMSNQVGTDPNQWDEVRKQNEEAVASTCLGFALDITNIQNEVSTVNTVWDKYKYDLLTGASDPEEVLPRCIEELKGAGLDTVIAEAQKQIDEFFK